MYKNTVFVFESAVSGVGGYAKPTATCRSSLFGRINCVPALQSSEAHGMCALSAISPIHLGVTLVTIARLRHLVRTHSYTVSANATDYP